MASYPPPTEFLPIYSSSSFFQDTQALTYQDAVKYFLRYPQAQGTQTLLNTNIVGDAVLSGNVFFDDLKNTQFLGTDSDGKLIAQTSGILWEEIGNDIHNLNLGDVIIDSNAIIANNLEVGNDAIVNGNLDVVGNLYVSGTETIINTETINLEDNLIRINYGQTGIPPPSLKSGIEVERGDLENYLFVFDESTDLFKVGEGVAGLQAVATRDDTMTANMIPYWNGTDNKFTSSTIDNTTLGYLSGATSNIQSQINNLTSIKVGKTGTSTITGSLILSGSGTLTNNNFTADQMLSCDSSKQVVSSGVPTSYMTGLTGNIQDQLDSKAPIPTLDPDIVVITDASGDLSSSSVSATTLGYLDATSSVQTQIDSKYDKTGGTISGNVNIITDSTPVLFMRDSDFWRARIQLGQSGVYLQRNGTDIEFNHHTDASCLYKWKFAESEKMSLDATGDLTVAGTIVGNALSVDTLNITSGTPDKAVITDGSGNLITSSTSATQIGYLDSLTSNVQDQIDGKVSKSGDTMTGDLIIENATPELTLRTAGLAGGKISFGIGSSTAIEKVGLDLEVKTSSNVGNIKLLTRPDGEVNFIERMRVKYDGNVGIGEDDPQALLHVGSGGYLRIDNLTNGGRVLGTTTNKDVISSSVSMTTLGYLDATSSVQTQLDNLDANKQDKVAGVDDTEIGYLNGVSSNIQGQINGLLLSESYKPDVYTGAAAIANPKIVYGQVRSRGSTATYTVNFPSGFEYTSGDSYSVSVSIYSSSTAERRVAHVLNKTTTSFQVNTIGAGVSNDDFDWMTVGY